MEKIINSAIKFRIKGYDENDFQIMCGKRHSMILHMMYEFGIDYDKPSHVQGFMTSNNRFVDRFEAYEIALKANQFLPDSYIELEEPTELYSEDLWY